jgi:macrolide transport system ATP-binding/permease protein
MLRRLKYWMQSGKRSEALREEMELHIAEKAAELEADGLTPQAAMVEARRRFGNAGLKQEESREIWMMRFWQELGQDVRYGCRTMAANKAFSALAVLSLALGIGANTVIYSFLDGILLRRLPVRDPQSLVMFNWQAKDMWDSVVHSISGDSWDVKSGVASGIFPYPAFEEFQKETTLFSSVFGHFQAYRSKRLNVTVDGQADVCAAYTVTGEYFSGLGVTPAAGRMILPGDDRPGNASVAVVSHTFSEARLGGAARAVGRHILLNNQPFTVIGVTPAGFFGVDPAAVPDLYLPMHANEVVSGGTRAQVADREYIDRNYYWVQVMARLRPGVTLQQAQAVLAPKFHHWVDSTAATEKERADLPALVLDNGASGLGWLRRQYSQPLFVLMALVGLILALACANVTNLLLARATARGREMALRLSVGAGRFRLVRQLLTESVLLAGVGGVAGIMLALAGMRALTLLLANGDPTFTLHAELNWHVLGIAAALSIATGILFGLAPALRATRVDVMPALKEGRSGRSRSRFGMGNLLVAGQVAISLMMLVAAGLFVRTLDRLHSLELGFDRENILLFQLNAGQAGHKDSEVLTFYGDLRRRFAAIPGVRSASLSEDSLIQAGTGIQVGPPGETGKHGRRVLIAGPEFLTTMGIPLRIGRDFNDRDRADAPAVAIVNESSAKALFPNRNPLGQRLIVRDGDKLARDMEIIGVCADTRYGGLTRKMPPVIFLPFDQGYPQPDRMVYALRTRGNPMSYAATVREIVRRADPRVPVMEFRTEAVDIDRSISEQVTFAQLCSGFAILALVIACVGLYGTVSYNVARRTSEIGIRMALGAQRAAVLRMVLGGVLLLALVGLMIGMSAAMTTTKFVKSFLYEVEPNDPTALSVAAIILLCAALLAACLPAWKASRIDPMAALRHE